MKKPIFLLFHTAKKVLSTPKESFINSIEFKTLKKHLERIIIESDEIPMELPLEKLNKTESIIAQNCLCTLKAIDTILSRYFYPAALQLISLQNPLKPQATQLIQEIKKKETNAHYITDYMLNTLLDISKLDWDPKKFNLSETTQKALILLLNLNQAKDTFQLSKEPISNCATSILKAEYPRSDFEKKRQEAIKTLEIQNSFNFHTLWVVIDCNKHINTAPDQLLNILQFAMASLCVSFQVLSTFSKALNGQSSAITISMPETIQQGIKNKTILTAIENFTQETTNKEVIYKKLSIIEKSIQSTKETPVSNFLTLLESLDLRTAISTQKS